VAWSLSKAEAQFRDRSMRAGEQATALEEGWLLVEMSERFGYDQEELARRFYHSVSSASRRMGLVELLPAPVQQQVRSGAITAHVAMKFLVPMARSGTKDCCRMAESFARHRLRSREAGQLYAAWRGATPASPGFCGFGAKRRFSDPLVVVISRRRPRAASGGHTIPLAGPAAG
jgi:hypothetical protein